MNFLKSLRLVIVGLLSLLHLSLTAQTCDGNLGENIFEAGDFGSGAANVLPVDPGIAPGFLYQPTPPPNDGFYTITNDMRRWARTFGTWDAFPDNSTDPNGYMMIVNAAFEPGLFYEQQVDGLCENTLYQFTADVRNVLRPGSNNLLPNVSFLLNGTEEFTTGFIAETGAWETFGFTFTTGPGQTELTLALRNNAPGGIGNDLALDNISFRACGPEARIEGAAFLRVCEDQEGGPATLTANVIGDQYDDPAVQWQRSFDGGVTWTDLAGENALTYTFTERASGEYFYRYLLANGVPNLANRKCRVVSNVKTVVVVPKRIEVTDTICRGLTLAVGSSTYGDSGVTVDTLLSSLGCDSVVTLRLTVVEDPGLVGDFTVTAPSCSYLTDGRIALNGVLPAGPFRGPFTYELDSLNLSVGAVTTALAEGDYAYRITDRFGCAVSGELSLRSPNPFVFDLGPDQRVQLGQSLRLPITNPDIVDYAFTPAGVVNCTADCDRQPLLLTESVALGLTATSAAGCVFTDSLRITVIKDRLVYPPTAFSPNLDGVNDRFTLFAATPNVTAIANLSIYDRWGSLVYRVADVLPNDISVGWDGDIRGRPAAAGTYYYSAEVVFLDGVVQRFGGDFVLVR